MKAAPLAGDDPHRYPVPAGPHVEEHIESRSRFVAAIAHTPSVDAARAFIQSRREVLPEATHHVYAFVVGHGASVTHGMSDAGEPSGTAGPPVLAQLRGSGLGDACIVVSRLFGGIKLGTGGLVRAYGAAARLTLEGVPRREHAQLDEVRVRVSYAQYEVARRVSEAAGAVVRAVRFEDVVVMELALARQRVAGLAADLADATSGSAGFEVLAG